jgi:hypothetical protein
LSTPSKMKGWLQIFFSCMTALLRYLGVVIGAHARRTKHRCNVSWEFATLPSWWPHLFGTADEPHRTHTVSHQPKHVGIANHTYRVCRNQADVVEQPT